MKSLITCFLHLGALNAFAVAQPVYDRVISNPQYFRLAGYSGVTLFVVMSLFLLAIPVAVTALVATLRSLKFPRVGEGVFAACSALLVVFLLNVALRWLHWRFGLRGAGIPDMLVAVMSIPLAFGCVWLYRRFDWPGQLLSFASIGIVLFPLNLFSTPEMHVELLGKDIHQTGGVQAKNPVPIVMITFDGLCGMSLLNERHEIDTVRYPSFARLAKQSTYYRNATSVHARTSQALPAILTGQLPDPMKTSPVEASHPDNLFRLIYDTDDYEMSVFEPFTRLCPTELRRLDQPLSNSEQILQLTWMLTRVYIATSVPPDLEFLQFHIPRVWFGFVPKGPGQQETFRGLIVYGWDAEHDLQVDHFTQSLVVADKPGFHFLHIVIPHDPWSHLPSGKSYLEFSDINQSTTGSIGLTGELWGSDELMVHQGWQRYLLQLQYADRCLGRIMDRLEEIDEFHRSLLVVVADHGMAFVPGQERRTPTNETLADLMSVPLFIKLPGQMTGETTDRNVETIDVLPTIADIIQLPLTGPLDGTSLLKKDVPERPRKTILNDNDLVTVMNPDFPERFGYVSRMVKLFGTGGSDDRLWTLQTIPELVGIKLAASNIGDASRWTCRLSHGGKKIDPAYPDFVPCFFLGILVGPEIPRPVQIAIAVNGQVECTTRTSQDLPSLRKWMALLPEDRFTSDTNAVQLFEVERTPDGFSLHEIRYGVSRS